MLISYQLRSSVKRMALVTLTMLILVVSVSAYTVVMHGGRRTEIPSTFVVTASTLTYEVSPGFQVTLQVAAINIEATERANSEPSGAFLRRIQSNMAPTGSFQLTPNSRPTRTITNQDLEPAARRRRESEVAYHQRIKEMGLPSLEESRRRTAEEADAIMAELREKRMADDESESYWRARATELRTDLAVLDAEIGYVRSRLEEIPPSNLSEQFISPGGTLPFGTLGTVGAVFGDLGGRRNFPGVNRRGNFYGGHRNGLRQGPGVFVAPRGVGPQLGAGNRSGGNSTRGRGFSNRGGRLSQARGFGGGVVVSGLPVVGQSNVGYDYSYERSELINRFNELSTTRAGMKARFRELEEEARRAGVPPGWLRE